MRLTRSSALSAACVAVATAAGTLVAAPAATAAEPTAPFISEIHYDNTGADVGEFVEVQVPGRHQLRRLEGRPLQRQRTAPSYDAASRQPAPGGDRSRCRGDRLPGEHGVQNGSPDGLALVTARRHRRGVPVLRGPITADRRPGERDDEHRHRRLRGRHRGGRPVAVPRATTPATDTYIWPGRAPSTKGTRQPAARRWSPPPVNACDATPDPRDRRGPGHRRIHPGRRQQVTVRGVVVGDVPGLDGFYLQDADGDGNPATSDGIFVVSPVAVGLGDTVAVIGAARTSAADPDHLRSGTSRSAPTAPRRTCPLPRRWTCRPTTPSASARGHAGRARSTR